MATNRLHQGENLKRPLDSNGLNQPRHLTTAQFAIRTGYHREHVRRMIREGRLPAIRFSKLKWLIPLAYVEKIERGEAG